MHLNFIKFDTIDSTNNYAKENIHELESYDVIVAKNQTSGRGRRGNTWVSSEGMALFSFILEEDKSLTVNDYLKLPLIVGISLLETLDKLKPDMYEFKWTNDVYLKNKKVSGILIERKNGKLIIGIGVNLNNKIQDDLKDIAISLELNYDIEEFIRLVIRDFINNFESFKLGNWSKILEKINEKNFLKNKDIIVKVLDKEYSGKAFDIDYDGRLSVCINDEIKYFNVGEVQIIKK